MKSTKNYVQNLLIKKLKPVVNAIIADLIAENPNGLLVVTDLNETTAENRNVDPGVKFLVGSYICLNIIRHIHSVTYIRPKSSS